MVHRGAAYSRQAHPRSHSTGRMCPLRDCSERLVVLGVGGGSKSNRQEQWTTDKFGPAEASWRRTVAILRGGGVMLLKPSALHTKALMAAPNLSGLTACTLNVGIDVAGAFKSAMLHAAECCSLYAKQKTDHVTVCFENQKPKESQRVALLQRSKQHSVHVLCGFY